MTAHIGMFENTNPGTVLGQWVRAWPTLPAFATAIAISVAFIIAAHRMKHSHRTEDPNSGPYTSDSWEDQ
jgi:hypothetical protein